MTTAETDATKAKPKDKAPDKPATPATDSHVHKDLPEITGPAKKPTDATPSKPTEATKPGETPAKPGDQAAKPGDPTAKPGDHPAPTALATEAPHLSQEVINKKAQELHDALSKKGFFGRNDPDVQAVTQALSGTTEADRKAIEAAYGKGQPDKLRTDMRSVMQETDFRKAEATLNTHDGRTNDAGALMSALALAKTDKEAGSNQVRAILQSLDSKTIAQMKDDFKKAYGQDLVPTLAQADLNDTAKYSTPFLLKGVDKIDANDINRMAHIALENNDQRAFCEAIRGDSPQAKEARAKLLAEPGIHEKLQNAFLNEDGLNWYGGRPEDKDWQKAVDPVVNDYLNDGKISLKTVVEANRPGWPFDNVGNTALAAQHASDTERAQFIQGKQLSDSHATNLTPDQQAAVKYYNEVHDAFNRTSSPREASTLEDQLIHGRETIVSQMAETHSDGYTGLHMFSGHNQQDLMGRAENLSKEDWLMLTTHPQGTETQADADKRSKEFRSEIAASLNTYADPGERDRIMKMLDEKAASNSFEASQQVKRTLSEVMDANTSHGLFGTSYDTKNIVGRIGQMSQSDVDKYKTDAAYRQNMDQFIQQNLTGAEQLEARRLLDKANETGKPPVMDSVDNFLMGKVNGNDPTALVGLAEKAMSDPQLRQRLNQPDDKLSPADKELKAQIQDATARLEAQNTPPSYGEYVPTTSGPTAADMNKALFQDGHMPPAMKLSLGFPRQDVISELPAATQAERDAVGNSLTPDEKAVVDAAASKNTDHQLDLADKMRLAAIGSKGAPLSTDEIAQQLGQLSNEQKIALKNEYATKYGGKDLDTDFGQSLDNDGARLKFRQLLETTTGDGRQHYYDNYAAMLKSESGFSLDGSKLTMERANDLYATSIQEYQRIYKTLPPEKQQALDKYFGDSMQQYKDSKEKLAEIVVDATITAAALAAAPLTAGASTIALMSAAAAFGATFRVAAMAAIEGNDFDGSASNITKQMVIGGTSAAMNFFGGGGVAEGAAEGTAASIFTREGAIAAAKTMAKEMVQNGVIGATSNVVSDVVVAPWSKDGLDIQQLERSAASGFIAGAIMPVGFKVAGKAIGASKELVVNLTREADGLHINPKNLTAPVTFRNVKTGEEMHFTPGQGESVKLTKDWLPAEVAAPDQRLGVTQADATAPGTGGPTEVPKLTPAAPHEPVGTPGDEVLKTIHHGPDGPSKTDHAPSDSPDPALKKVKPEDTELPKPLNDTPPPPPPHNVNNGETVLIDGTNGTEADVNGPDATVHVKPATPGSTVDGLNLKLNEGGKAVIENGSGLVAGAGTVEVSGDKSNLLVKVPEGETMRLVLREGSPDIHVSPDSKGKIEVIRENGLELPEGLRKYRDNARGQVEVLERQDAAIPRGDVSETPPFNLESVHQRTAELENLLRKNSETITPAQWRDMFDGVHDMHDGGPPRKMTPDERKMAIEIMQQSAPNMNSRAVDAQMKELGKSLDVKSGEKITVYVADGASDGNALAHTFAKNNPGVQIEIKQLTGTELATLKAETAQIKANEAKYEELNRQFEQLKEQQRTASREEKARLGPEIQNIHKQVRAAKTELWGRYGDAGRVGELPKSLVFDDLSHMTPEQRQVLGDLSSYKPVTAADNGFSRGMNMYDFATTALTGDASSMQGKLADIVRGAQTIKAAHPGMTDQEAVAQFMKEGGASSIENGGQYLKSGPENASIERRRDILKSANDENQLIDMMYNHATEPMVSKEQMNQYLADIGTEVQRTNALRAERGLEPLSGKPEDYQNAALLSLEHNVHFNDYGTMVKQAATLDNVIKGRLAAEGLKGDDYLVVTGLESDGSGYLANSLYARANGLPADRFISMDQLRALSNNPAEAEKILGNKKLVFLEDYRNSGRQQAELLAKAQDDVLSHIVGPDGQPLVKGVIAGNFGSHQLPEGTMNPFTKFGNGRLFNAEPHTSEIQPAGTLAVESVSGDHYVSVKDQATMVRRGTSGSTQYYQEMGAQSMYSQSSVSTSIFTPYGTPNNNPRYLARAERYFDLPMRYKDEAYSIFTRAGEKEARPVTTAGINTFHGGAATDEAGFQNIVQSTDADMIIDLRGADPRETEAVEQESRWAKNNPSKPVQFEQVQIPDKLPKPGTPEYDQLLTSVNKFEGMLKTARAEGKNVFYHCAWGQDRTGLMQSFDEVINQGKSVDEALADWRGLKNGIYDRGFMDLYHEDQFKQMIADYRARYGQ